MLCIEFTHTKFYLHEKPQMCLLTNKITFHFVVVSVIIFQNNITMLNAVLGVCRQQLLYSKVGELCNE
jgi:hypothetical protein